MIKIGHFMMFIWMVLSLFTICGNAEERHVYVPSPNEHYYKFVDPLVALVKNDFTTDWYFVRKLKRFADKKNIAGLDTTFLGNFSVATDKLPDYIVTYLDRELKKDSSHNVVSGLEFDFRNMMAFIRFAETENLDFLRMGVKSYCGYALRRIAAYSPLYEQYLREGIEHKIAEYVAFWGKETKDVSPRKWFSIVSDIDLFIHAMIVYKKEFAESWKDSIPRSFTSEYLFPIWVFVHRDLFLTNTVPQRWQKFAAAINKDINKMDNPKFCYGVFAWIGEIFTLEFKDTKYAEQLKRFIGDEKEWNGFLECCKYTGKYLDDSFAKQEEFESKVKKEIDAIEVRQTPAAGRK